MKLIPGVVPEIHKPELRIIAGIYLRRARIHMLCN